MKPTHTPTPWLVRFDEDRYDSKLSVLEVIDGSEASLNHPQGELVLARVNVSAFAPHMDEPLANARLIAAAPELLAALEAVTKAYVELVQSDYPPSWSAEKDSEVIAARAAIAKAKGNA
jgi:hypothetical protein